MRDADHPATTSSARGGAPPPAFALLLAALAFTLSLTPSLMPRDPLIQGALGGIVGIAGYAIGLAMVWLWRALEAPTWRAGKAERGARLAVYALSAAIAAVGLFKAADWQNETRAVIGLAPVDTSHPLLIAIVAIAVFAALWLVGWLFTRAFARLRAMLDRFLPRRIAAGLGVLSALALFWAVIDGVLVAAGLRIADASFEAADNFIEPDQAPPADPLRTGSAASLVRWEEMGRWGRAFVASAPTAAEISAFVGPAAQARDPLRVYVGRRAAATPEARAELALRELIRVGGFDRRALVVMVPVGTGWMDPGGQDTLDFIMDGDVATVAVQYSYLTSALSLWTDPDYGFDQARALFDAVYAHWITLPKDARPRLYVHGLSQGALNSQLTLPLLDVLGDPIAGALWVGSPFMSPFWQRVQSARRPESPAWRPLYGNGSLVRSVNQGGAFDRTAAEWGPMRIVFLQYASDPIVGFSFASGIRPPDWLARPRAFDVSESLIWFPLVTMVQIGLDTMIALDVPGYGHYYVAADYIDGWAAVLDPPGWSPERAAALKAIFAARRPAF